MTTRVDSQVIDVTYRLNHQQATSQLAAVAAAQDRLASSKARSAMDGLTDSAKNLAGRMAPAAAAISSVSAALGNAGGAAGKLAAGAGQVLAAFGAAGPIGAALAAGTIAVDAFSAALLRTEKAREAAFELNFERQYGNILRISKATQDLNDQIRALDVDIMYAGVDGGDRNTLLKQQEVFRLREEANSLRNQAGNAAREIAWSERERLRGEARALEVQADKLEKVVDKAVAYKGVLDDIAKSKNKAFGSGRATEGAVAVFDEYSFANTDLAIEQEKEDAKDRIREETAKLEQARQDRVEQAAKARAARILSNEDAFRTQNYEQQKAALEKLQATQEAYAVQGFGVAASAAQGYLDAVITGQENAEAMLAASLMRTAGQALISHGVDLGGRATVSALSGLLPLAAAQGAGAAALIAGGVALGGVATGITHVAAGGTIGKALPAEPKIKDLNTPSPRSSGNSDGITINYMGASGATAEESHKAVLQALNKARKRGWRPR